MSKLYMGSDLLVEDGISGGGTQLPENLQKFSALSTYTPEQDEEMIPESYSYKIVNSETGYEQSVEVSGNAVTLSKGNPQTNSGVNISVGQDNHIYLSAFGVNQPNADSLDLILDANVGFYFNRYKQGIGQTHSYPVEKIDMTVTQNGSITVNDSGIQFLDMQSTVGVVPSGSFVNTVPSSLFLPIVAGDNISLTAQDNKLTISSTVDTSTFVTEESLEGRVIPEGSSSNFENTGRDLNLRNASTNIVLNTSSAIAPYISLTKQNAITGIARIFIGSNELYFQKTNNYYVGSIKRADDDSGMIYQGLTNNSNTYHLKWNFNDVQTQITGNNLVTALTGTNTLNIDKVYTCTENDTSNTYLAGHIYKIGGTSGAYTAADITPSGSGGSSTTYETLTVSSTSWSILNNSSPYTYQATVTLTTTLSENSVVELINNQAVLFATYNFAIGQVNGQNITIYSIGNVGQNIDFLVGVN